MQTDTTRLSPDEAEALVRDWWAALGNNEQDKVLALLHDDVVWEVKFVGQWLPANGVSRGKTEVTKNCIELFAAMYDTDRLRIDITNVVSNGDTVVLEFAIDGYTTAGARYDNVEYVSIVELADGKVRHVREYMDALKAKAAHSL